MVEQYIAFTQDRAGYLAAVAFLKRSGFTKQQIEAVAGSQVIEQANAMIYQKQEQRYEDDRQKDTGESEQDVLESEES